MQESTSPEGTTENWVPVFASTTDYEADLVRDRLGSEGIPAAVHSQRDHAFNLTSGDLARVRVMVPAEHVDAARALLDTPPVSDAELEAQAMAADPASPDAYDPTFEASLDSGAESISFAVPGDFEGDAADTDVPRGADELGTMTAAESVDESVFTREMQTGTVPLDDTRPAPGTTMGTAPSAPLADEIP